MPGARRGGGRRPTAPAAGAKPVKGRSGGADTSPGTRPGGFALDELRELIGLVQSTGIGELEVTTGGRTVRIAAQGGGIPVVTQAPVAPPPAAATPAAGAGAPPAASQRVITSPMVGTFYRSPAPDADPYVEVGDAVSVGQTVCIVEAMKLMNEIESEVQGRVVKILVENAQPVEYGQPLFLVEP